ncbi:MAG: hypothetical protein NVS9B4_22320 [Candidatus Acidiferrum sp.]
MENEQCHVPSLTVFDVEENSVCIFFAAETFLLRFEPATVAGKGLSFGAPLAPLDLRGGDEPRIPLGD